MCRRKLFAILMYGALNQNILLAEKKYFSLKELISRGKEKNFAIRENAEKLYQAHKQIKIAIGKLLPGLNFSGLMGPLKADYYDLSVSLLGFLYPSNWFNLQESRLYAKAQNELFAVLLANEINAIQAIFFRLHNQKIVKKILKDNLKKIDNIVKIVEKRYHEGEDTKASLFEFENIKIKITQDYRQIKTDLKQQILILAKAVGFEVLSDWQKLALEPIELPVLDGSMKLQANFWLEKVLSASRELLALQFLKKAAHISCYERAFEFVMPSGSSDAGIGFGYPSYLKIGKSNERIVQIQFEQQQVDLKKALMQIVYDNNLSIVTYGINAKGEVNSIDWYKWLIAAYKKGGDFYPSEYIKVFQDQLNFSIRVTTAQHIYLTEKANLDRLLWRGEYYSDLHAQAIKKVTQIKNRTRANFLSKFWRHRQHKKENKLAKKKGFLEKVQEI